MLFSGFHRTQTSGLHLSPSLSMKFLTFGWGGFSFPLLRMLELRAGATPWPLFPLPWTLQFKTPEIDCWGPPHLLPLTVCRGQDSRIFKQFAWCTSVEWSIMVWRRKKTVTVLFISGRDGDHSSQQSNHKDMIFYCLVHTATASQWSF